MKQPIVLTDIEYVSIYMENALGDRSVFFIDYEIELDDNIGKYFNNGIVAIRDEVLSMYIVQQLEQRFKMPVRLIDVTANDNSVAEMCADRFLKCQNFKLGRQFKRHSEIKSVDIDNIMKFKTGFSQLDNQIGGLYVGQVSVLFSYAGEGKSTFASVILNNLLYDGVECLAYSGELDDGVVKDIMDKQMAKRDWIEDEEFYKSKYVPAIEKYRAEHEEFWLFSGAEATAYDTPEEYERTCNSVSEAVMTALEARPNLKFVLIDNLMTAMDVLGARDDLLVKQSEFMENLVGIARDYQCHIMLVCHSRKENYGNKMSMYDISGTANIPNKAGLVMSIQRTEDNMSFVSVYKDRYNGARMVLGKEDDGRMALCYRPTTRTYVEIYDKEKGLVEGNYRYNKYEEFWNEVV